MVFSFLGLVENCRLGAGAPVAPATAVEAVTVAVAPVPLPNALHKLSVVEAQPVVAEPEPQAEQAPVSARPAGLVVREVEGWKLYQPEARDEHLVKDTDISERAGLAMPRDIRRHVKKAAEDGVLTIVASGHDASRPTDGAFALAVTEVVEIGSGAHREVTSYYLSQEAALHVLLLLRTPKALELRKDVVRVYLAVKRGESPDGARVERLERMVEQLVGAVASITSAVAALPQGHAQAVSQSNVVDFAPKDWVSAYDIAQQLTGRLRLKVSASRVDRAIRELGIRERGVGAARQVRVEKARNGFVMTVPKYFYAPTVVDEVGVELSRGRPGDLFDERGEQ